MKQKSKKKENQRKFLPLKNVKHRLCFDSLSVTVCEHRRPSPPPSPPSSSSAPQREGSPKDLSKNLTSLRKGAPTTHFSLLSLSHFGADFLLLPILFSLSPCRFSISSTPARCLPPSAKQQRQQPSFHHHHCLQPSEHYINEAKKKAATVTAMDYCCYTQYCFTVTSSEIEIA